jgi:hypothetical protein
VDEETLLFCCEMQASLLCHEECGLFFKTRFTVPGYRLGTHEKPLLKTREENRRLRRNWPIDLIRRWTTPHQYIVIITTLAYRM